MERKRNFQDLDLSNAFLFAAAMSDPITCSLVLELILDRTMGTVMVQSEKSVQIAEMNFQAHSRTPSS